MFVILVQAELLLFEVQGVPKILSIDQSQNEALDIKKEDDDEDVSIEIQTQFDESYLTYLK